MIFSVEDHSKDQTDDKYNGIEILITGKRLTTYTTLIARETLGCQVELLPVMPTRLIKVAGTCFQKQ